LRNPSLYDREIVSVERYPIIYDFTEVKMPTAHVYSPVTGNIHARNKYCLFNGSTCQDGNCTGSGANHNPCSGGGGASPIDVDTSDNGPVRIYANSAVKSIRTFVNSTGCCSSGCGDVNRTVKVNMYGYTDGTCFIGAVLFAHIANPQVGNNQLYLFSGSKLLGYAPGGSCGCYSGSHAHIERIGGTTSSNIPCCCNLATGGSTQFYSWTFSIPCADAIERDK
jgi:hypothetical protein